MTVQISTTSSLDVTDLGMPISFTIDDVTKYHGPGYPGGVAHAFKVLERALALLADDGPVERREITIATAHAGPGVRDTMELVTRAVTSDRFTVDPALARTDRGILAAYVFVIGYRHRTLRLEVREGFVTDEFITLGRKVDRTDAEDAHLTELKKEMAGRLLASAADDVYDVVAD
ncbi:hypothetical protein BJF84_12245 [Rhodococcus sp. CUA-806]|jgi:hypothetical protein|nr:hypothetical protein BJF84_12245 [Rhodococcus sp. CUA-806]